MQMPLDCGTRTESIGQRTESLPFSIYSVHALRSVHDFASCRRVSSFLNAIRLFLHFVSTLLKRLDNSHSIDRRDDRNTRMME